MNLKEFFVSMFKVGCIGFGGGSALIPVLHKTYVEKQKIIGEREYEEAVVVSSITPGALTIKLAGEIGRQVAGWKGMLAGASAMALPGVFLTVLLLSLMSSLSQVFVQQMKFLTIGVMAYIACMLTDYVWRTIQGKMEDRKRCISIGIILLVFMLTCGKNMCRLLGLDTSAVFCLSTLDVFIVTFLAIGVKCGLSRKKNGSEIKRVKWNQTRKELVVMLSAVLLALVPAVFVTGEAFSYAGKGMVSSMISFGGGDAYLTVADGLFISTGLVTEDAFYGTIVPLVNILPGSILCKALSGIGYWIGFTESGSVWGGCIVAVLGFVCSFAASCGIVSVVGNLYRNFGEMPVFQAVKQWIRPVVSGLMLNVVLSLVYQSRLTGVSVQMGWMPVLVMLFIYGMNLFFYYRTNLSNVKMVVLSVVLSLVLCNILAVI